MPLEPHHIPSSDGGWWKALGSPTESGENEATTTDGTIIPFLVTGFSSLPNPPFLLPPRITPDRFPIIPLQLAPCLRPRSETGVVPGRTERKQCQNKETAR